MPKLTANVVATSHPYPGSTDTLWWNKGCHDSDGSCQTPATASFKGYERLVQQ
ncbi:MAG: hypothetical protein AAFY57_08160 [Cyanobacteria bacterium J06642_2]